MLAATSGGAVLLVDLLALPVTADPQLLASPAVIGLDVAKLAVGISLLAGARFLAAHNKGRGTGALLVGAGATTGAFLSQLATSAMTPPLCDLDGGDSCVFDAASAPLWFAVPRYVLLGSVCVWVLALLTLLGRADVIRWLRRNRLDTPVTAFRQAAVALVWCAANSIAVCVVGVVAVRQRATDATSAGERHVAESAASTYGIVIGWLGVPAVVFAVAAALVAVAAWRGTSELTGHVRTYGGLVCTGQLLWAAVASTAGPTAPHITARMDAVPLTPLPGWYPPTSAILLVSLALTALTGLILLVVTGLRTRT